MDDYDAFYRTHRERLFAYLLRFTGDYHLAGDLVQEAFTRCLARYGRNGNHCALLFAIARNAALDALRKCREVPCQDDDGASQADDPEHRVIQKQGVDRLLAAIRQLSSADRELIALLAAETFSYRTIGEMLAISEASVKVRVHRARLRLRAILAKGEQ